MCEHNMWVKYMHRWCCLRGQGQGGERGGEGRELNVFETDISLFCNCDVEWCTVAGGVSIFPDTSHTYITQRLGKTVFPSISPRNVWLERPRSHLPWRNGRPWEYNGVSPAVGGWRAQGWIIEELIIWKFCNQLTCLRCYPKICVVSGKYSGAATHKTWTQVFFPAPDATH